MNDFTETGENIRAYAQAALAVSILEKETARSVIKLSTAETNIQIELSKDKPSLINLIQTLLNAPGDEVTNGEEFLAVLAGDTAYTAKAKRQVNPDTLELEIVVIISKRLTNEKQEKFGLAEVNFPPITVKKGDELKYQVIIKGKEVFNQDSPKPMPSQLRVINKYADAIVNGKPQQLAIMGTGTGKSWVIAGITHANHGEGIIVVPNDALADEMKTEAILKLHGPAAEESVHISKEYSTIEEFTSALATTPQMILIADDPLFHEKAMAIRDRVVLMDESHQHTFTQQSLSTLESIKDNNALLALTGTPTSKLKTILGGSTLVDINVRSVMDRGGLRQNCRKSDTGVLATDLIHTAVMGYFGRDEYPSQGLGLMSIDNIRALIDGKPPVSEEKAIDIALDKNRQRGISHKNFVFTGHNKLRQDWIQAYQDIADGIYPNEIILCSQIQRARRDAEIDARVAIMMQLHPEQSEESLYRIAEAKVGRGKQVNLVEETQQAQKSQIAMSLNTHALALLYPKKNAKDFEKMQRKGEINDFIINQANAPKNLDQISYDKIAKGLPPEQREKYIALLKEVVRKIHDDYNNPESLCTSEDINLQNLQAHYTASATTGSSFQKKTTEEESAAILDQMRCGLVMHVASDTTYATGISISSVLGVQQIVSSAADKLNNPVDAPQLHGRNIRDKDLAAFNHQIVNSQVPDGEYVKLEDIYAEDSGNRMDKIFEAEKNKEIRMGLFHEVKSKFEDDSYDQESDQNFQM
ncbi:MAG: DEAD/DEAH box helicase family protein [Legionellaceae bacterium]|nr:DEAD/DEAH box helicase family protein [Legionellaceae bacterium]